MAKTIPQSPTFLYAKQRHAGIMQDKRMSRLSNKEEDFSDDYSFEELKSIRKDFIDIYEVSDVKIDLNRICLYVSNDLNKKIPDEFQGIKIIQK